MVANQGLKTLNLYDVFANIVPGLYLILGSALVVKPVELIDAVFAGNVAVPVGIPLLLTGVAVSFVVGQLLQMGGSRHDDDHGFDALMWRIRGRDTDCRYSLSDVEDDFWEMCRGRFDLTWDFESHDKLFKLLLSYLESSERSRALRLQALYLFVRGIFVASIFLAFVCYGLAVVLRYGYLPGETHEVVRSREVLVAATVAFFCLAQLANRSRAGLERDWIEYTVVESYLEMVDEARAEREHNAN